MHQARIPGITVTCRPSQKGLFRAHWLLPIRVRETPGTAARYAGSSLSQGQRSETQARRTALAILVVGGFAVIFISVILWATRRGENGHH
jgi:hypothetical protein